MSNANSNLPDYIIGEAWPPPESDADELWLFRTGDPTMIVKFTQQPDSTYTGVCVQAAGNVNAANIAALMRECGDALDNYLHDMEDDIEDDIEDA